MSRLLFVLNFNIPGNYGLGNRLKGIVSLLRLQNKSGTPFGVSWPIVGAVPCEFNELFSAKINLVAVKDAHLHLNPYFYISPFEQPIDGAYETSNETIRQEYVEYFKKLGVISTIPTTLPAEYIGLHIRTGNDWEVRNRGIPLTKYFQVVDNLKDIPIYVVTHDYETLQIVKKRYGSRVYSQINKDYKSIKDALVDMLVLGNSNYLICDSQTSFSECAWYFGGAKSKVIKIRR